MADEVPNGDREERRSKWLKRLAGELIKLEPLMPITIIPAGDECPEWARRVEQEIGAVMMPHAKVKEEPRLTPQRMGALLGHQCGNAVWMMECLNSVEGQKFRAKPLTEEERKRAEVVGSSIADKWYPGMRRLAKIALAQVWIKVMRT